jgi:hypothetical protein
MTALPSSIRVGYRDYDLVVVSPLNAEAEGAFGRHSSTACRIEVRTDTKPAETADTLIHETLHAVWNVAGLQAKDSEERIVTSLAHQLTQVIRDNPELVAYLTAALAPSQQA